MRGWGVAAALAAGGWACLRPGALGEPPCGGLEHDSRVTSMRR